MSVYTHPSKPGWQMIKISHGRKEKPEYISFPGSRDEALIFEAELRGIADKTDPDFADSLPAFRMTYKNEVAASTFTDFEFVMRRLQPFFSPFKIRQITPMLIEQYKAHRLDDGVCKRTINRELAYLSKYFQFCGHTIKIPAFRKKDTMAKPPDILTMAQLDNIISHLYPPVKYLIQLMAYNGLRRSEAFKLQSEDVDFNGKTIRILGKGNKWRTAPVENKELQMALAKAKQAHPTGPIFPNPRTKEPYKDIRTALKNAAQKAGIDKRVYNHLCRHSFATALVGHNVQSRVIQELLGHADIAMLQTYTHINNEHLRKGANTLAIVANRKKK
jgi:integrase/recombinase XerD